MRVVAVIPARGGSKGVPDKNLRPVGGVPLVVRAALAAQAAARVGETWVSTDSPRIAAAARGCGAGVIDRPEAISGDAASSESALLHALDVLEAAGAPPVDVLVFLQCTSPFTTAAEVERVAAAIIDDGYDSAFSATPTHGFIWRVGADGAAEGINHDASKPRRRRQELPPQFQENGAVYAMRASVFRAAGARFCGRVGLVPTDLPIVEIDAPEDLDLVEAIAARRRNAVGA